MHYTPCTYPWAPRVGWGYTHIRYTYTGVQTHSRVGWSAGTQTTRNLCSGSMNRIRDHSNDRGLGRFGLSHETQRVLFPLLNGLLKPSTAPPSLTRLVASIKPCLISSKKAFRCLFPMQCLMDGSFANRVAPYVTLIGARGIRYLDRLGTSSPSSTMPSNRSAMTRRRTSRRLVSLPHPLPLGWAQSILCSRLHFTSRPTPSSSSKSRTRREPKRLGQST